MVFTCFFRQWTFFALNRWILIGGTCLCLSLPLLSPYVTGTLFAPESVVPNLSLPLSSLPALQADVNQSVETAAAPTARLNSIWLWATLLYGAGRPFMESNKATKNGQVWRPVTTQQFHRQCVGAKPAAHIFFRQEHFPEHPCAFTITRATGQRAAP